MVVLTDNALSYPLSANELSNEVTVCVFVKMNYLVNHNDSEEALPVVW